MYPIRVMKIWNEKKKKKDIEKMLRDLMEISKKYIYIYINIQTNIW